MAERGKDPLYNVIAICRCDETENIARRDEETGKRSSEFDDAVNKLILCICRSKCPKQL